MKSRYNKERNWKRMSFDEKKLGVLSVRERSEIETDRDLEKPIQQLVCNVHEETHNTNGQTLDHIACAQKRIASLTARVAMANDKLTKKVVYLTWFVAIMTLVITIFTILLYFKA